MTNAATTNTAAFAVTAITLMLFPHESRAFAPLLPSDGAVTVQQRSIRTSSLPSLHAAPDNKKEGGGGGGGIFGAIGNFFDELDAFVDDATSRRLGNGAQFYGKRKSNFYGESDRGRKADRDTPDPLEDYQGPSQAGYFKWMMDPETGEMKPVTRLKEKNIERNPNYWDRVFKED